jgi:maltooligosyltrehalose trehalohydrolase
MLDWYRRLIAFRLSTPDLTDPDLAHVRVRCSEDEQWLVMERGSVTVAFSLALQPIHLEVRPGSTIALASTPDIQLNNNALTLPPDAVAVLTSE